MSKSILNDKKIIIFSGAGISAESGISTFRDTDGLWDNYKIEEVCNYSNWKQNFELVHHFYNERRADLAKVKPNRAHELVAQLKQQYGKNCHVITQNIDDLFERAGCSEVVHVHGELTKMQCTACANRWEIGYKPFDIHKDRCPKCHSIKGVKPFVVFFGEAAPKYTEMYRAFDAAYDEKSVVVVIGTMGNVVVINELLRDKPCKKILNNLEASPYIDESLFDSIYYEKATVAIEKIVKEIEAM